MSLISSHPSTCSAALYSLNQDQNLLNWRDPTRTLGIGLHVHGYRLTVGFWGGAPPSERGTGVPRSKDLIKPLCTEDRGRTGYRVSSSGM